MTTNQHHVVLGGNGASGRETVRALIERGERVTSVGRRVATVEGATPAQADLLNPADVSRVLADADVAYLTVGLPYSRRVWAAQLPVIVRNVAEAASERGVHVVYLDNVYALGRVNEPMTEASPIHPSSNKGEVRANALEILASAARERGLAVTTARSADFYGPGATTSVFNLFAINPIAAGKSGSWLFDAHQPHSMTYTPDIGEALAILGTNPAGVGRVWHIPSAPALTGAQWLELVGGPGTPPKVMSRGMMRLGGLFNTSARETLEMGYQFENPYFFDTSAFESTFGMTATSAEDGVRETLSAATQGAFPGDPDSRRDRARAAERTTRAAAAAARQ